MAVEFELPVLRISMAAVDKMQGPDALQALWTVFTKTTGALQDGPRLENMTWRLWYRQLNDRVAAKTDDLSAKRGKMPAPETVEVLSDDNDSEGDWEDDSAPPSRDPVLYNDPASTSTRRQLSTAAHQPAAPRSRRHSGDPGVLSASQPTSFSRPAFTSESRSNSAPGGQLTTSHGAKIGHIISHLLPEKVDLAPPSWALAQHTTLPTAQTDHVPSTPRTQPAQFLIHSPSTPPNASDDYLAPHPAPTLMVIHPTPRPTPPDTPARTRAVPTDIPAVVSPGTTPLALAPPSALSQPRLILVPGPSATDQLDPSAALPLTPAMVEPPDMTEDDSKKKIFYVQSPEGATASDDGQSHSSSSNSNTTSNVTDPNPALSGHQVGSLSSATTNELPAAPPIPEAAPAATQDVSVPRGTNHARNSSTNTAYTRPKPARSAKVSKPSARVLHRGRPNTLMRTASNSSDRSHGGANARPRLPMRQQSVSEEVAEEAETVHNRTSAATSHTITSVPPAPAQSGVTSSANNTTSAATRVVSNPQSSRPLVSSVKPPSMIAQAAPVAPLAAIHPTHASSPTASSKPPHPPTTNNSSALLGLGRRAVHVETSSDLDLESDSQGSWSDDETDSEGLLIAQAANEVGRQRNMFEKIRPKPAAPKGLLTNLMHPDPNLYPHAAHRHYNSAHNLAAMRRAAPAVLKTSRSSAAVPTATPITAEQITTHVAVDPKGRTVDGSGSRGLRLGARPEGEADDDGSTDEENSIPNELSKSVAHRRLEAFANKAQVVPSLPAMEQVRHGDPNPRSAALAPRPAPQQPPAPYCADVQPIHSPRTVRRHMISGELSESLRRNLMWERTSTRHAMGGGAFGSGLRPLTAVRPSVTTMTSDRGPRRTRSRGEDDMSQQLSEARKQTLARNRSWANDFHHAGW